MKTTKKQPVLNKFLAVTMAIVMTLGMIATPHPVRAADMTQEGNPIEQSESEPNSTVTSESSNDGLTVASESSNDSSAETETDQSTDTQTVTSNSLTEVTEDPVQQTLAPDTSTVGPDMGILAASSMSVSYVDASGTAQTPVEATLIESTTTTLNGTTTGGWYYASGDVTINSTVKVNGNVKIILTDGCKLTIIGPSLNAGIDVTTSNSLTIYGQANGTGAVTVTAGDGGAGIGGALNNSGGTITVNGGMVKATGGGLYGAGIGGGQCGSGGNITVNGGTVTATGGSGSAGIGGGANFIGQGGGGGGVITITGGTVNATGGINGAAGIGGGGDANSGTGGDAGNITISGGIVTATGGTYGGSGIGSGRNSYGGTVRISGGTIFASRNGATGDDIGSGRNQYAATDIIISGGSVKAVNIGISPQPTNGNGTPVYLNTLTLEGTPADANISVGSINAVTCAGTPNPAAGVYGIKNVKTDGTGKVSFWLPKSTGPEKIVLTSGTQIYNKSYIRAENNSNAQILYNNAEPPTITSQPTGGTVNLNGSISALSVAASVTDGGTLSYQWYSNTVNTTTSGQLIAGANLASYTPPTTSAGTTYYYCVVTNTNNLVTGSNKTTSVTSNTAGVTVNKGTLSLTLTCANSTYGGTPAPQLTGNTGGGTVTYEYKVQGTADTTYSQTVPTAAGNYTVRANVADTANYNSATSAAVNFTIAKATPSITLTASPSSGSLADDSVTLTATLTGVSASDYPTGSIAFKNGSTTLATVSLTNGTASFVWPNVPFGTHNLTAEYTGDSNYAAADDTISGYDVQKKTQSTLEITGVPSTIVYGDSSFSLDTTGGSGAGAVTYTVQSGDAVSIIGNIVTIEKSGTAVIRAVKAATDIYNETSAVVNCDVAKATPGITLTATPSSGSLADDSVTLTATLTGVSASDYPTGSIVFKNGGTELATVSLTDGTASFFWEHVPFGTHDLKAEYTGDNNYAGADDTITGYDVQKKTQSTLEITGVPSTLVHGDSSFTLGTTGGSGDGTVTYTVKSGDAVSIIGNIVTIEKPGTAVIQAVKAASDIYNETSAEITLTVNHPALTGTATISKTSPVVGDVLTASLTGSNNTGTLQYIWKAGGVQVGTNATYTVTTADLGKSITVTITSDVETGAITSSATSIVVKKPDPAILVAKIKTISSVYISTGKSVKLPVEVFPVNATDKAVTWSSTNKSIATVTSAGIVKGIRTGKTTIVITSKDGKIATQCTVYIVAKTVPLDSFVMSPLGTTRNMTVGQRLFLKIRLIPLKSTNIVPQYKSSNSAVATVNSLGKITTLKAGKTTITVTVGKLSKKLTITVSDPATKVTLNKTKATLSAGKSLTLKAQILPTTISPTTLKWTTSNSKVATVSSTGVVKGMASGKATITVKTTNGKTATCTITVK